MLVANHYTWNIRRLPDGKYELRRDGEVIFIRDKITDLYRDNNFHYDYERIKRELDETGESELEVIKGKFFQL